MRLSFAAALCLALVLPSATHAAGTERDALGNEAIELMIENSGAGQAEALLGILYLRGMRSDPDPVAAIAWLDRAARAGHPAGVYAAARVYAEGIGVPVDAEKARALLRDHDPARFGPLAGAVRQLRLSLDLPAGTAPPAAPETAKAPDPAPAPAADAVAVPVPPPAPPPAPVTEPALSAPAAPAPGAVPAPSVPVAAVAAVPALDTSALPAADPLTAPAAQLATLFSESSTAGEVPRLRAAIPPALLAGRDLVIRTTRLADGRVAWRVLAIGFNGRDEVKDFCAGVRAAGLACIPRG
jgi:hypothetical protein